MREWLEKELEKYIIENPNDLRDALAQYRTLPADANECPFRVLGTQIHCDFGKIDMLCTWIDILYVVEFKAITADEKALGQVMRYVHYIETSFSPHLYLAHHYPAFKNDRLEWKIEPVLIAPGFSRSILNCHCPLITSEQNDDNSFSLFMDIDNYELSPRYEENLHAINDLLKPFALELIGRHVGQIIADNIPVVSAEF